MTGSPYGVGPGGSWPPPAGPPPQTALPAPKQSRAPVVISVAIAVIAMGVAIGSWLRPSGAENVPPTVSTPQYTDQDVAKAKEAMCDAYDRTLKAIAGTSGSQSETDPIKAFIMTVNTRFSFHITAEYFLSQLERNPATPQDLAENFRKLAASYDELLLAQLANTPQDQLDPIYQRTEMADNKVVQACG